MAGGPAAQAGMQCNDLICTVNNDDVRSCKHDSVVLAMKTKKGTMFIEVQQVEYKSSSPQLLEDAQVGFVWWRLACRLRVR